MKNSSSSRVTETHTSSNQNRCWKFFPFIIYVWCSLFDGILGSLPKRERENKTLSEWNCQCETTDKRTHTHTYSATEVHFKLLKDKWKKKSLKDKTSTTQLDSIIVNSQKDRFYLSNKMILSHSQISSSNEQKKYEPKKSSTLQNVTFNFTPWSIFVRQLTARNCIRGDGNWFFLLSSAVHLISSFFAFFIALLLTLAFNWCHFTSFSGAFSLHFWYLFCLCSPPPKPDQTLHQICTHKQDMRSKCGFSANFCTGQWRPIVFSFISKRKS